MRRFLSIFGSLLTVTGIGLLILTVLLQYSGESKRNHLQQTVTAEETPSAGVSEELPSATATALPPQPPAPKPWKPNRIRIPKIDVDSPVVEAPLLNGRWQIPKFAAGHLERTAYPGEIGNVAMTGHLDGYDNSNVFARLRELSVGDGIVLLGENNLATYIVSESKVVKRDDMSVIEGTTEPVLTLITCAGIWNPLIGEYNERLIVVAKLTKHISYQMQLNPLMTVKQPLQQLDRRPKRALLVDEGLPDVVAVVAPLTPPSSVSLYRLRASSPRQPWR